MKDDLNGLDKAVSAVLGERTIERNLLLVKVAKSKLAKRHDDKNEKLTKPEELVRLYDLLLQVDIHFLELALIEQISLCIKTFQATAYLFMICSSNLNDTDNINHTFDRIQVIYLI